ncbi:uncharacterized protein [Epargyreus clarus]|uniref:uncharacterized protein n=1 Tax=Epargyreus clarus TaxID=520877 RepID=UPI003C2C7F24
MPEDNKDLTLSKLKKKKASIKAKLTQFETHLNLAKSYSELSEIHAKELRLRVTRIENILQEFDVLQTEIESLCDCPDEQYADRDRIETQYYTLLHLHKNDDTAVSRFTPNQENVALATENANCTADSNDPIDSVVLTASNEQHTTSRQILLSTALVKVHDTNGGTHTARLLLDNGSTANFMTLELCSQLGLLKRGTYSTVSSIGNQSCKSTQSCQVTISSLYSNYKEKITCLILPKITKLLPNKLITIKHIPIPSHVQLADPSFNVPAAVDILVGAEIFWNVICNNSIDCTRLN